MAAGRSLLLSAILLITVHCWNQDTCPLSCHCQHREVNCTSRSLHVFPTSVPADCQVLLLAGNQLQNVVIPEILQLHTLDLQHNQLAILPDLSSVPALSILLFAENSLVSLDGLQNATQLKELSVGDNRITHLDPQWFKGLLNLEFLHLQKNQIESIPPNCFQDLNKLTTLTLSYNLLPSLDSTSLSGLQTLAYLFLDNNRMTSVPTASLSSLPNLKTLTLSGNLFQKFRRRNFANLGNKEMELTKLPQLFSVDEESFYKMKKLSVIYLHHNPKLTYLDPQAFLCCPQLHALYIHNNNLLALDIGVMSSLPQLHIVSLYHNRLHCDCNVHWIREAISRNSSMDYNVTFQSAHKLVCDTPLSMNAKLLDSIPLSQIPQMCPPTVIPFFNDSNQRELGQHITYECRAIGVPRPHIHWILQDKKSVNNTSNDSRLRLQGMGTLTMNHIKAIDYGTYTCVVTNAMGSDATSTVLHVHSADISILSRRVSANFIAVTWNGTGSTVSTSNYVIMYKAKSTDETYKTIAVRPYMRQYTINNLRPLTMYEFCIAYEHRETCVKLNCMDVKTRNELFILEGVTAINSLSVLITLFVVVFMILFMCLIAMIIRRYNKRKQYSEADGLNTVSKFRASGKAMDTISQIPLDNLYKLNSTPLCSSTTSLVSSNTTLNSNA